MHVTHRFVHERENKYGYAYTIINICQKTTRTHTRINSRAHVFKHECNTNMLTICLHSYVCVCVCVYVCVWVYLPLIRIYLACA
jgi:hypothetical protein